MGTREDAQELLYKFHLCIARSFFDKVDSVRKGSYFALAYLEQAKDEVIAGDLAKELNVSTARIAALLKKMEQNNLIVRSSSPRDARKTVVEITPEGVACINKEKEYILKKTELLLEKVGKADLEEFIRISYRIKVALDE